MSDPAAASDRLLDVERLTAALTDQILDAQIMSREIPQDQVQALAKAARLLHDYDLPWPPMLAQVLQTVMDGRGEAEPEPELSIEASDTPSLKRLSRFLGAFRRDKAAPDQLATENDGGAPAT